MYNVRSIMNDRNRVWRWLDGRNETTVLVKGVTVVKFT